MLSVGGEAEMTGSDLSALMSTSHILILKLDLSYHRVEIKSCYLIQNVLKPPAGPCLLHPTSNLLLRVYRQSKEATKDEHEEQRRELGREGNMEGCVLCFD